MTAVLLCFEGGTKEFVRDVHIHGVRDGSLQLATGTPGAGLDARVVRTVPVAELAFAETCEQDEDGTDGATDQPGWSMSWGDQH